MTIMDGVRLWLGQALVGLGILAVVVVLAALWYFGGWAIDSLCRRWRRG